VRRLPSPSAPAYGVASSNEPYPADRCGGAGRGGIVVLVWEGRAEGGGFSESSLWNLSRRSFAKYHIVLQNFWGLFLRADLVHPSTRVIFKFFKCSTSVFLKIIKFIL
jgi:hypothetical protein